MQRAVGSRQPGHAMNSSATFRPNFIPVLAVPSAAGAASCGDGGGSPVEPNRAPVAAEPANRAPTAVGAVPPQTITAGESASVNVSSYFNDPDGDVLTYAATTSSAAVAGVSVSGSTVTIAGVALGTATVTVTARDPGGLEATLGVQVTVANAGAGFRDDFVPGSLSDWQIEEGTSGVRLFRSHSRRGR